MVEHSLRERKVGGPIPPGGFAYAPHALFAFVRPFFETNDRTLGAYTHSFPGSSAGPSVTDRFPPSKQHPIHDQLDEGRGGLLLLLIINCMSAISNSASVSYDTGECAVCSDC